jgi:hypothetical protein
MLLVGRSIGQAGGLSNAYNQPSAEDMPSVQGDLTVLRDSPEGAAMSRCGRVPDMP